MKPRPWDYFWVVLCLGVFVGPALLVLAFVILLGSGAAGYMARQPLGLAKDLAFAGLAATAIGLAGLVGALATEPPPRRAPPSACSGRTPRRTRPPARSRR
jgi:hypothetical protein